jgi:rubrerythrin
MKVERERELKRKELLKKIDKVEDVIVIEDVKHYKCVECDSPIEKGMKSCPYCGKKY